MDTAEFLNERSVTLLEDHWSNLREEAYAENHDGGWRIHLTGEAKLFAEAGFQDDALIAGEDLLKYAKSSGQKSLVERLLAILEHIQREN